MKKILKFSVFSVFIFLIGAGWYIFTQNRVEIPNSMIRTAVKSRFQLEKSYPLGKIKLFNPKSHFEDNKLIIETEYINDALNDKISGTMTFETDIRYDEVSSGLYLENFTLKKLTKNSEIINLKEKPIIRTALNFAFSQLEKDELVNLKKVEKFRAVKDIKIENNKIVVIK